MKDNLLPTLTVHSDAGLGFPDSIAGEKDYLILTKLVLK
jgi:hypothetical protein